MARGNADRPNFLQPRGAPTDEVCADMFAGGPANELDCLRRVLAPELLSAAERRARGLGIGADQVLIQAGVIDESAYLELLATSIDVEIANLPGFDRQDLLLDDDEIPQAATCGIFPLRSDGELIWAITPRRLAARGLSRLVASRPTLGPVLRLVPASQVHQFLTQQCDRALGARATSDLARRFPAMSAAPASIRNTRTWRDLERPALGIGLAALFAAMAIFAGEILSVLLAALFLAFAGLRLTGAVVPRIASTPLQRMPDDCLPVYTVIAALYREATSVASLMQAIDALDYPREKLNVILVLEPDDLQTRAAVARLGQMPHVQILIAPAVGPRTKPKALNYALAFAHGSFLAVYDAEDRPEPGQLRAALGAFGAFGADVACVQASLCIDNISDSWLTRMFATEYAGQFDIFLPGLVALNLPLPLGGSSNHFRAIR